MNTPDVSVVIPTRDRVDLLFRHGLGAARSQHGVDIEVIVVDDGSTDDTCARVEALDDSRIRAIRRERGGGISVARNAGIAAARGTWVAFLDDDDLWAPTKLAHQLERIGDARWSSTSVVVVDEELSVLGRLDPPPAAELAELLRHGNALVGGSSTVVVERALLLEVGAFDEALAAAEDWDLWLRLLRHSLPALVMEPLTATLDHRARSFSRERRDKRAAIEVVMRRAGAGAEDFRTMSEWYAGELHRVGRRMAAAKAYAGVAWLHRSPGNFVRAVGAVGGTRGMGIAERFLYSLRRGEGVEEQTTAVETPVWLREFRDQQRGATAGSGSEVTG